MMTIPPPDDTGHTKCDQLFENKKPGYWIFEKEVLKRIVGIAGRVPNQT